MLYIAYNICKLEGVFLFTIRMKLKFADCPLIETWGLLPLSTTVGIEVKKPVRRNRFLFFVKKTSALSLDSQSSG